MSRCVCGHSRDEHQTVIMSIPLTPRTPLYELGSEFNSIARTSPNATYLREECWCGCGEYLEDVSDAAS